MGESNLFSPVKAVGLFCDSSVPLIVRVNQMRGEAVVYTAAGNAVHAYKALSLRVISISDPLPSAVTALANDKQRIFVACGPWIAALRFFRQVDFELTENGHQSAVSLMLVLGGHLISVDQAGKLIVWDILARCQYMQMDIPLHTFKITCLCHPTTYLNKILIGSEQGQLRLLNVRTGKVVHEVIGWGSAVTCVSESPAIDVVAIGLENGYIHLHHLKQDTTLFTFIQDWGPVVQLSFRTDGPNHLISGASSGQISVWDLDKQRLVGQMKKLHKNAVTGLQILNGEPIMITCSPDNSVRTWIFDLADGLARQLAERVGHSQPASALSFYGNDGEMILVAGNDSTLRAFSTRRDTKQMNFGTAGLMSKKEALKRHVDPESVRLAPIVALACEGARESAWENVICCHKHSPIATTWTSRKTSLGAHHLIHDRFKSSKALRGASATSCCISVCGNYCFVSYDSGHVDCYNMQSGIYRGSFVDDSMDKCGVAHCDSVSGVSSDAYNRWVITAGKDAFLKIWNFKTKKRIGKLKLDCAIEVLSLHRDNGLSAVALSDNTLCIVDAQCGRVVRSFKPAHQSAILSLNFSPDGQWLISTAKDFTLKVWELATSSLIDVIKFSDVCIGVSFSPTSEYVASIHEGHKGVYLWANKAIYSSQMSYKCLPIDYDPAEVSILPVSVVCLAGEQNGHVPEIIEMDTESDIKDWSWSSEQISPNMVTLSGLSTPRWAQLLHLDVIRERNKPKEPVKKPESVPFFLPTSATTSGFEFRVENEEDNLENEKTNLKRKKESLMALSSLAKSLNQIEGEGEKEAFEKSFRILKEQGPSGVDASIRSLGPLTGGTPHTLLMFMRMIKTVIISRRDFELAQSYLSLFIKLHRESLWDCEESKEKEELESEMKCVLDLQNDTWSHVSDQLTQGLCLVQWIKSSVL